MSNEDFKLDTEVGDDFLLDNIEDLPGFVTLPTGAWLVQLNAGIVEKKLGTPEKNFYEIAMTVVEPVEVDLKAYEEGEEHVKPGDTASMLFDRQHKVGMAAFKELLKPVKERFDCKTIADLKAAVTGLQMLIVVKRVKGKDKDGNERFNMRVTKSALT